MDEIIEEELNKFLGAVQNKFQREFEKGIRKISSEMQMYITQEKHNKTGILQFIQCQHCKCHYSENETHSCNIRGKINA
ncbi:hypothetical protein LEP1GSC193_1687 [Leptospira alstonii serovar Pingchang str. 80-412]|uniref:Uncharacterized protein n=2 Tax=Leptospira alstonii TaxID=28452 RepID=M6D5Z4_9LEPT|nr:hypothetical protein LEP1GSC194_4301 [Leptospira alstonii serovar Sichuan str. 79601]EQA78673.1 hypothetical protein LEP1GSC193_1687 [Leptospira alstonii serovar Pingchang str. 80-412]